MARLRIRALVACVLVVACGSGGTTGTGGAGDSGGTLPSHDAGSGVDATTRDGGLDGARSLDATHPDALHDGGGHDGGGSSDASLDHAASDAADATVGDAASRDAAGDSESRDAAGDAARDTGAHPDAHSDAHADTGVDAGPPTFFVSCSGAHTTLTGTVYAPNGTDPIPRVRVYAAEAINPYPANYCDKCSAPLDPAYIATTSASNGTFTLDLDEVPAGPTIDFAIQIGRFRKHTLIPVTACESAVVPLADMTLPGNSAAGDIPKIAVSSGNVDHLDAVLTALGITEYDCYEGRKTAGASTATCQQVAGMTIADVIASAADLDAYHMAFLSCAPGAYADFVTNHSEATMNLNTQSWVAGGGRIFVTDTAYDYIAQAFPNNITWAGAAGSPQPIDSANLGCAPGVSPHATEYSTRIDDPSLAAWLTLVGVASGSPTMAEIQGYYEPWATIASLPPATTLLADGTMPIDPTYPTTQCATPTMTDVPLTTQFEVPTCGRVVFSSFHTYTGTGASAMAANEKIMEYLIFAAAVCSG
jgi:hypothetical protein